MYQAVTAFRLNKSSDIAKEDYIGGYCIWGYDSTADQGSVQRMSTSSYKNWKSSKYRLLILGSTGKKLFTKKSVLFRTEKNIFKNHIIKTILFRTNHKNSFLGLRRKTDLDLLYY